MFHFTAARSASYSKSVRLRGLFVALAFFIAIASAQSAAAATYTVINTSDSGAGSLRQAVLDANGTAANDVIVFNIPAANCSAAGVCTITLSSEIVIANNGSLTISGTGANRLKIDGGAGTNRIFTVLADVVFNLSGVTLTGGNSASATDANRGGAIYVASGTTTIRSVYFLSNTAVTSGGGIFFLGGGSHRVENSTFFDNVGNGTNNGGGGICSVAGLTVVNSTFENNREPNGGGGAIAHFNSASPLTLINLTVVNNSARDGGGIYTNTGVTFGNSIIAGNSASPSYPEIHNFGGVVSSTGYNLVGDQAGDASSTENTVTYQSTDILDTPPLLDPLSNYGGTVTTRRPQLTNNPLTTSPAIDKGSAVAGVFTDGRGVIRPFDIFGITNALPLPNNGADIGAFELIPTFARGWGRNFSGQVGDGTLTSRSSPVDLLGGFTDIVSFEGGYSHGLGLRSNGTIVSWGRNDLGQLGRTAANNSVQAATPTQIPGLSNVTATAGGEYHSFAILADGTVRAWGDDFSGQLGDGSATTGGGTTPVTVATNPAGTTPLSGIIQVAGGNSHSIALKSDGTVWTWGNDSFGQLGDGAGNSTRAFAQAVPGLANVIAIDAGESHNLALLADGSVRAWGFNGLGQIGDNSTTNRFAPVTPTNLGAGAGITQIAAGFHYCVALKTDGTLLTWGDDSSGQLGDGTAGGGTPLVPTPINTISNVTDIKSTVGLVTYARKRDGSIFAWGFNNEGQIGNGSSGGNQPTPTQSNVGAGISVFGANGLGGYAAMPLASIATGAQFVRLGDATVNFPNVATAGTVQIRTFDPSTSGLTAPAGYTILANSNGYDINSSAQFVGNAQVCLKVNNVIDQTVFNRLTILHDDNFDGTFDALTLTTKNYQKREVCRVTQSFSPFVIAEALAPTAATVSVGGRVMVDKETGLRGATVTLTDINGNSRTAISSSFGYYRFDDVEVGATYFVSVRSKRYFFETQIINVTEDTGELDFTAAVPFGGLKGR